MPSSEFVTLDPELEMILREVAADPDSPLLRVTRPQRIRGLFERGGAVSERSTLLTKAERQLVRVYRAEVAWLLRQAALVKLLEGTPGRLYADRYNYRGGGEYPLLRPNEIRDRAREIPGVGSKMDDSSSVLMLVERCAAYPLEQRPTPADLAAASLRLHPTDEARVLAAMDFSHKDSLRTAIGLLGNVLEADPLPGVATSAWSYIGLAYSRLRDYDRSHRAYMMQSGVDPDGIPGWMYRLSMSLQAGDASDAVHSAAHIDELAAHGGMHVNRFVRALAERRRAGEWTPSVDALRLSPLIRDRIGQVGGRIADALA